MARIQFDKSNFRQWQRWLLGVPAGLLILLLSYLILRPDPAAVHFYRAQKLQTAGQTDSALRLYSMLVSSQPNSSFSPLALQQQGEILTGIARRSGDTTRYRAAIDAYLRLATEYPSHSLAGEALLTAANIAGNDLRDAKTATQIYEQVLAAYPANTQYCSEATLRLGRIALQNGEGDNAQKHFTQVLKKYSLFPERCAEAQYHLGITFETLQKNKSAARSAYEATIKKWPHSIWADNAKERIGLILYTDGSARPARRVQLELSALPAVQGNSEQAALQLLLAARGLEVSDTVWQGWSLVPFRAGFASSNPGRILSASAEFSTIAANAGLVYSREKFSNALGAQEALRNELDDGHVPFVNQDGWMMVTGYDSARDEFFTLRPGNRSATLKSKTFTESWKKSDYAFLSFHAPGEKLRPVTNTKPAAEGGQTVPELLAPLYSYKIPALSLQNAHRRTLKRAVLLMQRSREGDFLLNLEALRAVSQELKKLSEIPESPVPTPETNIESDTEEPQPIPTPTTAPVSDLGQQSARWKALRAWFGKPLNQYVEARRDAAAYLVIAGRDLKNQQLQNAAGDLRETMLSLQHAATIIPSADIIERDPDAARAAFQTLAKEIENGALKTETRAVQAMQAAYD
jgi:TolA-binding protein